MMKYVKILGVIPIVIALIALSYYLLFGRIGYTGEEVRLEGYMIVSDAGMPRGGFEWVGEYNLELVFRGEDGYLRIEQVSGLGDPLKKKVLQVDGLTISGDKMVIVLEGYTYIFIYRRSDPIWNRFNNTFTAIYSPNDDSFEVGILNNDAFEGFPDHYYIEIHLSKP